MTKAEKQTRRQQLERRYGGCEDAIVAITIMLEANKMLKKAIKKIYSDEVASDGLARTRTAVNYDLLAMKDEVSDIAMETAEDIKEIDNA